MTRYEDILHAERPCSRKHPPMKREERAKQFMPFATLRGYGDILSDREIKGTFRAEGDDEADEILNEAFNFLKERLDSGEKPFVHLEIYRTDHNLRTFIDEISGHAERLSEPERTLRLGGVLYSLDDIRSIRFGNEEVI